MILVANLTLASHNRKFTCVKEEWDNDVHLQTSSMNEYDRKYKIKMDRYNKMLADQRLYNTSEMKRKDQEATSVFDKDNQLKIIRDKKRQQSVEHKQFLLRESGRRSFMSNIAYENVQLANAKADQLRYEKHMVSINLFLLFFRTRKGKETTLRMASSCWK